jgi:hypothetical protein
MKYDWVCGGGDLELGRVVDVELGWRPRDEVRCGLDLFFFDDVDVCAEEFGREITPWGVG